MIRETKEISSSESFMPLDSQISKGAETESFGNERPLILITGKQEETRFMLRSLLEMWNFDVAEARTAEDSVELAKSRTPDLVLLDTSLHFEQTLDTMAAMKSSPSISDVPVIMISGFSRPDYRDAALACGAADFLVKPVDFDSLEQYLTLLTRKSIRRDGRGML